MHNYGDKVKMFLKNFLLVTFTCNKRFLTGGSIYNGNTLITQPTGALEFHTLYGTKDQGLTFSMADRILFYLSYLFSYRLLKRYTYIHFIWIHSN